MRPVSKDKLSELQTIISKMSLEACCNLVLPDIGLQLRDVSKAVRKARLPMNALSIAKILKNYVARSIAPEELDHLVSNLRLKLMILSGKKVWHTIKLLERTSDAEPVVSWSRQLVSRVLAATRGKNHAPRKQVEVTMTQMGDFVYLSLCRLSRSQSPLYVCACAGQCVAFVTSLACRDLVQAAVKGIGYKSYEDAALYGQDIPSLLRVIDRTWNVPMYQLTQEREYNPKPVITKNGIDYTNKAYDEQYVDDVIGPDPPLLTNLDITSQKQYFDPDMLDKTIAVTLTLKSNDIAKTLKNYVQIKAIPPNSDFIQIFHQIRSNRVRYEREEE